jgi:hypothetical protein
MAQMTVAASKKAFTILFETLRDNFRFEKADLQSFGRFTAGYSLRVRLAEGTIDLRADNTVQVRELDLKWERLELRLRIDIPQVCVGGFCIIPDPRGGCILRAPTVCVFEGNPDIDLVLRLGPHLRSEVSLTGSLVARRFRNPNRRAGMDAWDAREAEPSLADQWQIFLDPQFVDVDLIDVADTAGDLLEAKLNEAVNDLLSTMPAWVRRLVTALIGPVVQAVRDILDLPDDAQEWISDLLNVSFGIHDFILQAVADHFAAQYPLQQIETPFPVFPPTEPDDRIPVALLPVLIPIDDLKVSNDADEMILEAELGVL